MAEAEPHFILGSSGHARVVAESIFACGLPLLGHVGPETGQGVGPYLGDDEVLESLFRKGAKAVVGLGFVDTSSRAIRKKVLEKVEPRCLANIMHPSAVVSTSVTLQQGVFVAPAAVLGAGSTFGLGTIINTAAVVDHDCVIGINCHIATGARLAGGVTIGEDCLIGVGASIRQGVTVGSGAIVGVGAAVVHDVPAGATVVGVPAR